ncbi:methyltransferase domain-containing protein [Bacillus infantis]|uniref:class I SAM-dependent methyltransferase n=1 Tax=Bacillus infantis TaxID=324767 RepID=UPI002FBE9410
MTDTQTPYHCPFCNQSFDSFFPWPDIYDFPSHIYEMWNKETAICPHCHSLDRERLYRLYIERETNLLEKKQKLLHIAPETNLRRWISKVSTVDYLAGDLMPADAETIQMDIRAIPYPEGSFDVILCSHVLEHILEDQAAMDEIYRVLKPGGWSILQVPISLNLKKSLENPLITSPADKLRYFGQSDHVRLYSKEDFTGRLEAAGFIVEQYDFAEHHGLGEARKYGLSAGDTLYIGRKKAL